MPANMKCQNPRFNIGDQVKVTFPGSHRGKGGFVTTIIDRGDFVWRYRVHLYDDETIIFFDFELAATE
jgi:hypothetical protein